MLGAGVLRSERLGEGLVMRGCGMKTNFEMVSDKLRPCPFCGGIPFIEVLDDKEVAVLISCSKCGCSFVSYHHEDDAVNEWNTRIGVDS